jgi:nucleotide-binding universal stress UspA family protein
VTEGGSFVSTIVIGVDGSPRSEDAVAFAGRLAAAGTGDALVACAFPYSDVPSRAANKAYRDVLEREAGATARRMGGLLSSLASERVRTAAVACPSAAHALQSLAAAQNAALVVVGSSSVGTVGRVLPGATGELAYDGSNEAVMALSAAAALARGLDARLKIIGVLSPDPAYGAGELMGGSADPALREVLREDLRRTLDAALATVPVGVDATRLLLEGDPAERLIDTTAELEVLIIGSRGYGPLRAVLVGAVSRRVARAARCPVIVTPRGVEAPLYGLFGVADRAAVSVW